MDLFRSRAGKDREKTAAELPEQQTTTTAAELPEQQTTTAAAELPEQQTTTVKAQPEAARREAKYEARPDPDKPGWGRALGQEISRAREDRAGRE
jgi:hypothetical protein